MKKQYIYTCIFGIIAAVYISIVLLLVDNKDTNFWIGFAFTLFSILSAGAITVSGAVKRSSAFPLELSFVVLSSLYILAVVVVNILFDAILSLGVKAFLSIHIVVFAVFLIIYLLMYLSKSHISKQSEDKTL